MEIFNADIENILHHDEVHGTLHGKVCILCDKLLKPKEVCKVTMKTFISYAPYLKGDLEVPEELRNCYKFVVDGDEARTKILGQCLLSPRSKVVIQKNKRKTCHVVSCKECRAGLSMKKLKDGNLPRFAIANKMTIGTAPPCIATLNEIELALISQARFRGHLFSYWGGCHRSIKGWHSFYEVDPGHTNAVLGNVAKLTESKNIAVVLLGPFTKEQKQRIKKKTEISIDKCQEAFKWLKANNRLYQDAIFSVDVEPPVIIDRSEEVESENSDIEIKEEIRVVFPDGTIQTAGASDGQEFEKAVADMKAKYGATMPFLTSRPSAKVLHDYEDETLMRAFPLQFPYGYGYHSDFNGKASENGYLKHLLSLSLPALHRSDFVLVVHNMFERSRALNGALWQVMGQGVKCDVSEEELNAAISRKLNGLPSVNGPGTDFLQSVQCVTKRMAHSNGAAQAAQAKFLSLTHHFGCPKVLFTVSFDDSLDIRILALSGKTDALDWIASLEDLSPLDRTLEMDRLNAIRVQYPGLCAFNFECLLDLVLEHLVGDNDHKEGIFGQMTAYGVGVEEQGRKTLHGHILVFTKEWNYILKSLLSSNKERQKAAETAVIGFVDKVMSTEMVPSKCPTNEQKCPSCQQAMLEFASDQQLRHLRHKVGCHFEKGVLATCSACKFSFQGDELAMKRVVPKESWDLTQEEVKSQVALEVLKGTTPEAPNIPSPRNVSYVNYRYNHHLSFHTKTCFKKDDEGRCALPERAETQTQVIYSEEDYELFEWTGQLVLQPNVTVRPKRLAKDAYTNTHCKAISACKAPANSNVSVTTGARSTIYASCYTAKGTQKEDSAEFKKMASYVGHRFQEQRNENTLFEGLSRLMGSVIVSTCEHVVSAPMAAYLVRNQSRFRWSVNFKYIPVNEVLSVLDKQRDSIKMSVLGHSRGCFLTNEALHYLHRPKSQHFEKMSMVEFFQDYEIVRSDKAGDADVADGVYDLDDEDHPGFKKQVIRKRKEPVLAQFSHWMFPDSASFGGNLLHMDQYPLNSSVEKYCRTVLLLYHPFRIIDDLTLDESFHKKFKYVYQSGIPPDIEEVLENVQMFYNSMRLPAREDPIRDSTIPFKPRDKSSQNQEEAEEDDEDFFDGIFDVLFPGQEREQQLQDDNCQLKMSLDKIRGAGGRRCGFSHLPSVRTIASGDKVTLNNESHTSDSSGTARNNNGRDNFVSVSSPDSSNSRDVSSSNSYKTVNTRDKPTPFALMSLTYRNVRRRVNNSSEDGHTNLTAETRPNDIYPADGTALSILLWSKREGLKLDAEQQLAFQIATAAFVLTYYDDAQSDNLVHRDDSNNPSQVRRDFQKEKKKLLHLARLKPNQPLFMFLSGPGGSGKSRVVKELLKYAEEYCSRLNFKFDLRTIITSAMSGVAAVSINGETTHSVAALNKNEPTQEDIESWANARLLIIDEVSFMNVHDVDNLDKKLRILTRRYNNLFGGIHILFCGDFRQLEPVTPRPLYSPFHGDKKWISAINCYVELLGLHRFSDDPEWGRILTRLRNDVYTQHDIDAINARFIQNRDDIPRDASYCTYGNADRTAINAGIFVQVLKAHYSESNTAPKHILAVKASNLVRLTKKSGTKHPLSNQDKQFIYENCADNNVQSKSRGRGKGHFVDPMLKLYYHIPLMLVTNKDVSRGHANGTRVLLEGVILKHGATTELVKIDNMDCPAVDASLVDHFVCSLEGEPNKLFHIEPEKMTCTLRAPLPKHLGGNNTKAKITFSIACEQLPLIVNNCTTGHKLQGQTKQNLVISTWSTRRNWNYVALSRVTTRNGLFLAQKLGYDADFSMPQELRSMMEKLQKHLPASIDWDLEAELLEIEARQRGFDYHHTT